MKHFILVCKVSLHNYCKLLLCFVVNCLSQGEIICLWYIFNFLVYGMHLRWINASNYTKYNENREVTMLSWGYFPFFFFLFMNLTFAWPSCLLKWIVVHYKCTLILDILKIWFYNSQKLLTNRITCILMAVMIISYVC